jgi:N-acetyl sugar amidotransferase
MKKCNRCLFDEGIKGVVVGDSGQCNYCDLHDTMAKKTGNLDDLFKKMKKGKKYDCLVGISGGFDSTFILHLVVSEYKLNPLVVHFDNGWNGGEAESNMSKIVDALGVDYVRFKMNTKTLDELNLAFLKAGVPDCDIPNDIGMQKLQMDFAEKFKIKSIINGHNYRYEGSTPLSWTYMDAKYIQSVAKEYNIDISGYPIFTFRDQLKYMRKGYKTYRILDYYDHNKEEMKAMLSEKYGWVDYGGNHAENIYTEFVGSYLLPRKFGINKKRVYKSAEIRSGKITKEQALKVVNDIKYNETKLKRIEIGVGVSIDKIMAYPITDRTRFDSYHKTFKKYRWFLYIATKMGYFPMTFYKKYCL